MTKVKMHKSITSDRILKAAKAQMFGLDNGGFCLSCGKLADGCDPDARKYECESCGQHQVYGAQELMMMIAEGY